MTDADLDPGPTILYVEDSPTNQELMRDVVRKRPGVRLLIAGTGTDAVEVAVAEEPNLILLDRRLPDMTGDEILHVLRSRPETEHIPVVVVSGDTARPHASEADLGVIGYLTKPFDIHELLAHIDQALGLP